MAGFSYIACHYIYPFLLQRTEEWGRDGRLPAVRGYQASEGAWEKQAFPASGESVEYFVPPFVYFNEKYVCFRQREGMRAQVVASNGREYGVEVSLLAKWHESGAGTVRVAIEAEDSCRDWPPDDLLALTDLGLGDDRGKGLLKLPEGRSLASLVDSFLGDLTGAAKGRRLDTEGPPIRMYPDPKAMDSRPLVSGPAGRPSQYGFPVLVCATKSDATIGEVVGRPESPGILLRLCTRVTHTPDYARFSDPHLFTTVDQKTYPQSLNANQEVFFNFGSKGGVVVIRTLDGARGLTPDQTDDVRRIYLEAMENVRLRWYVLGSLNVWLDHWLQDLEVRLSELEAASEIGTRGVARDSPTLLAEAEATMFTAVQHKAMMARLLQGLLVHEIGSTGTNAVERRATEVFKIDVLLSLFSTKQAIADSTARDFLEAVQLLDFRMRMNPGSGAGVGRPGR